MLPFKYGRPMQGGVEIRSPPRFLERSAPGVPRGSPAPLPASPSPVTTLCLSRTSEVQEVPQGRSSPEREIMRSNLRLKSWF
nr:uncharacterized protein LOC111768357 isoform X4 [Equus caballus]